MIDLEIKENTVLVVAGPTASGKSATALDLAEKYHGVIINADASQIYKGIPILSAAPSSEDQKKCPHFLYEIFEPEIRGSVAEWLPLAVQVIRQAHAEGKCPIVVGGTGFYLESLINGTSPIPETKQEIKDKVRRIFDAGGVEGLYAELQLRDKAGAAAVHAHDTTRVRRALEIFLDTGKSIVEWFQEPMRSCLSGVHFQVVAKLPPLSRLEGKCSERFDQMIAQGAVEEVKALLDLKLDEDLPVMKAIGVPEIKAYLEGEETFEAAVRLAKLHTRQYAKRQLTWFRNRLPKLSADVFEA